MEGTKVWEQFETEEDENFEEEIGGDRINVNENEKNGRMEGKKCEFGRDGQT